MAANQQAVIIEHCGGWGYAPKATRLVEVIQNETGLQASTFAGRTGSYEIKYGDKLIYSKLSTGQFPTDEEILAALK